MALVLSKANILTGNTIQAADVSQSIDAFTGLIAYDLTITGSLNATGSVITGSISNATSSSLSTRAVNVTITNVGINNNYTIPYLASTGSNSTGLYYSSIGPTYNPFTDELKATASYANTASVAITASMATTATNVNFTYRTADDITYTASVSPFPVGTSTPYNIYVSQSSGNVLGLNFVPGNDGQIVNFTPNWKALNLDLTTISIIASTANVFGLGGVAVAAGNNAFASTLIGSMVPVNNTNNLTFQYISTVSPPIHQAAGWYLINPNVS